MNFTCELDWAAGHPDIWSDITLSVSVMASRMVPAWVPGRKPLLGKEGNRASAAEKQNHFKCLPQEKFLKADFILCNTFKFTEK